MISVRFDSIQFDSDVFASATVVVRMLPAADVDQRAELGQDWTLSDWLVLSCQPSARHDPAQCGPGTNPVHVWKSGAAVSYDLTAKPHE